MLEPILVFLFSFILVLDLSVTLINDLGEGLNEQ